MEKPANTEYPIHYLLTKRYSPRTFASRPVDEIKLRKMIEAGRWSPSSSNEQPWRYVIGVKGKDKKYEIIYNSLTEANKIWNNTVPVLILVCAYKFYLKSGKENPYRYYDAGQSAAHMTFQAMEEGLFVHQMGGFDKQKIHKNFDLPDDIEPLTVMAVGYMGELSILPEHLQSREKEERTRKSFDELILD